MGQKGGQVHSGAITSKDFLEDAKLQRSLEDSEVNQVQKLARRHTRSSLAVLVTIARNKHNPPAPRVTAARAVLEFGWGRPGSNDSKRGGVDGGITINILSMSDGKTKLVESFEPAQFSMEALVGDLPPEQIAQVEVIDPVEAAAERQPEEIPR